MRCSASGHSKILEDDRVRVPLRESSVGADRFEWGLLVGLAVLVALASLAPLRWRVCARLHVSQASTLHKLHRELHYNELLFIVYRRRLIHISSQLPSCLLRIIVPRYASCLVVVKVQIASIDDRSRTCS